MIARLKKARYRYRSFIPGEDVRLSAVDALRQVASSSGVLVTLEEPSKPHALVHNIRSMFVAGLADGMGKPLLVLCPAGTDAPLDIRDEVEHYRNEGDIAEHITSLVLEVTHSDSCRPNSWRSMAGPARALNPEGSMPQAPGRK